MNMEGMLNKLRSTVSSAASNAVSNAVSIASQVSNYLPGNPVTREYEATEHIASAGRGLMWKIYKGYKKSTKQEAAIFLFEKRQLEKWDRVEREQTLEKMRKGISQLTRLRHPQVLTVQHPLEESRETLAFATEPVHSSLANALGKHDNMPSPLPSYLKDFKFYDVEIKYGLMQVAEGLGFLHNSVKIVHRSISSENIVLNQQGAWKLFGFDFCVSNQALSDQPPLWSFEEYDCGHHPLSQPEMDYLAPEYALTHKLDPSADMFSLGVVIHSIYNKGKPVFQNHNDFAIFKNNANELKNPHKLTLDGIPNGLKDQVKLLLNATAELRPDALQFAKISYFDDLGVKTLSYLDQLFQWDNMQKSQFYKGLPQILPQIPHRVSLLRVVPCLVTECVNPTMVPFVLPIILQVAESASKDEFVQHILPHLKPLMKITDPIQIMLLLMLKMELLLSKTPAEDIRTDIMPFLYRALECDTQQIQELCLSVLPTCAPLVDQSALKNAVLPRIKKLCVSTGYLSVRVNCLVCIGKVLEHLDKWLVVDDVFPFMSTVPSKEAPVVMAMVGIFKVTLYHKKLGISKEVLANKVLPFLFPLSIENSLSPSQHLAIMTLIKDMTERVETEHKAKLQHLDSIRSEQKSLEMAMPTNFASVSGSSSKPSSTTDIDQLFASCSMDSNNKPNSSSPGIKSSLSAQHLTLEDKQRIANEQKMQSNSSIKKVPLLASPPAPSNPLIKSHSTSNNSSSFSKNSLSSKPLATTTSTQSNTWSQNLNNVSQNSSWGQMTSVNNSSMIPNSSLNVSQSNSFNAMQNNSFMPLQTNSYNNVPNNSFNAMQNNYGNMKNTFPMMQGNSMAIQSNLNNSKSSFIPPMVSNIGSFQPLTPMGASKSVTGSTTNEFKPLSSSDINDFLS